MTKNPVKTATQPGPPCVSLSPRQVPPGAALLLFGQGGLGKTAGLICQTRSVVTAPRTAGGAEAGPFPSVTGRSQGEGPVRSLCLPGLCLVSRVLSLERHWFCRVGAALGLPELGRAGQCGCQAAGGVWPRGVGSV